MPQNICYNPVTHIFDFSIPLGTRGTSESYDAQGVPAVAYGYTIGNAPVNLFGKNQGLYEIGLGIDSEFDHEIDPNFYIQVDLLNVNLAKKYDSLISMCLDSVQSGETYLIYGSNIQGQIGTLLTVTNISINGDSQTFDVPNDAFGNPYRYISVTTSIGNVLLNCITFVVCEGGTGTAGGGGGVGAGALGAAGIGAGAIGAGAIGAGGIGLGATGTTGNLSEGNQQNFVPKEVICCEKQCYDPKTNLPVPCTPDNMNFIPCPEILSYKGFSYTVILPVNPTDKTVCYKRGVRIGT